MAGERGLAVSDQNLLTIRQVAERLSVSYESARALISYGHLEAIDLSASPHGIRRQWRVNEQALAEFIERRTHGVRTASRSTRRGQQYAKAFGL